MSPIRSLGPNVRPHIRSSLATTLRDAAGLRRSVAALTSVLAVLALFTPGAASAQSAPPKSPPADWGPISINLEEYEYPYPVS